MNMKKANLTAKRKKRKKCKYKNQIIFFIEPDNKKRTLKVCSARTGKRIKLNEQEAHFLADALTRQIREWR